jgi:divalent metal cation (Fe/Co/Zn/Cd) transporter
MSTISKTERDFQHALLTRALWWSAASLGWALLAGGLSVAVGFIAGSTALVGFGLGSVADGGASGVLIWRFSHELTGHPDSHKLERRAILVVGVLLALISVYLVVRATIALADHAGPHEEPVAFVLTAGSVLVLPVLAYAKIDLAGPVGSRALRADGVLSAAGAALAAATMIGLALSTGVDLWWADSVAALLIAVVLARESGLTLRARRDFAA